MSRSARGPRPAKVQEWSARLARFHASQMSVADFCRAESVSPASLYRWKKQLAKKPGTSSTGANGTRHVDVDSGAQSTVPQATRPRLGSDATAHVSGPKRTINPIPYRSARRSPKFGSSIRRPPPRPAQDAPLRRGRILALLPRAGGRHVRNAGPAGSRVLPNAAIAGWHGDVILSVAQRGICGGSNRG